MGLFSFTDEEYAAYEARQPADPAKGAADATRRLRSAAESEAWALVRAVGPRAARLNGGSTAILVGAIRDVLAEIAGVAKGASSEANFAARVVVDAWCEADESRRLVAVRKEIAFQYRDAARRDEAAASAARAWRALELAEDAATSSRGST